jgi:hypothetical protein
VLADTAAFGFVLRVIGVLHEQVRGLLRFRAFHLSQPINANEINQKREERNPERIFWRQVRLRS